MTEPIAEYTTRDFSAVDRQISEIANREKVLTRRLHIGNIKRIIIIAMGVLLAFGLFLILAGIAYRIAFKPAIKIVEKTSAIELTVKSEPIKIQSGKIDLNIKADPIKINPGSIDIYVKPTPEPGSKKNESKPNKDTNTKLIPKKFFPTSNRENRAIKNQEEKISTITEKIRNNEKIINNNKSKKEIEITQLKEIRENPNKEVQENIAKLEAEIVSIDSKIEKESSKKAIVESESVKLFKTEKDNIYRLEKSIKNLKSGKEERETIQQNLSKEVNALEEQLKNQEVELSAINNGGAKERELRVLSDTTNKKRKELQEFKKKTEKIKLSSKEERLISEQETKTKIENIQKSRRMDKRKKTREAKEALKENLKIIKAEEDKKLLENETEIKNIEKDLKKMNVQEKELKSTNDKEVTGNKIEKLNEEIQKTKIKLGESKSQLKASKDRLTETRNSEDKYKSELERSKSKLDELKLKKQNDLKVVENLIRTLEQKEKELQTEKQLLQKSQTDSLEKAIEKIEKKYGKTIEELIAENQKLEQERTISRKEIEKLLNREPPNKGAIDTKTSVHVFKTNKINFKGFTIQSTGHKFPEKTAEYPEYQHCYIRKDEIMLQLAHINGTDKLTSDFRPELSNKYNISRSEWNQQIEKCVWF